MTDDEVVVRIERMGLAGEGVAKLEDGRLAFVAGGLPGETVRAHIYDRRRHFVRSRAIDHLVTSVDRVTPVCPIFDACGGCTFQHWDYPAELAYKEERVRQALIRTGHVSDPPIAPIRGARHELGYRNKGQFPFGQDGNKITLGLYRRGTHQVVPAAFCAIQDAVINDVLARAPEVANEVGLKAYDEQRSVGVLRHLLLRASKREGRVLALMVVSHWVPELEEMAERLMAASPVLAGVGVNLNPDATNRVLGHETRLLAGRDHLFEDILGLTFRMSFDSFFQVNPEQVSFLYQLALETLPADAREVWDLYAGVGTLSALMAQRVERVRALEIHPGAIRDAELNARLNHLNNVTFHEGDAEVLVGDWVKRAVQPPDTVMVDPPRSGLKPRVIDALLGLSSPCLTYVSCNPETLARDVSLLAPGYRLESVSPVDMFPRTDHVEIVSAFVHV